MTGETLAGATAARRGPPAGTRNPARVASLRRFLGVGLALALLVALLALTEDRFLHYANIMNILRTNAVLFVVSTGLTFVIVSQGLDLSIGSMVALGGVCLATMLARGVPVEAAVPLTTLICTAIGTLVTGSLIAYGQFNFFVVTLAMMQLLRGASLVVSNGIPVSTISHPLVQFIGDGAVHSIPVPVILAILTGVVGYGVMRWTRFGRAVYAVGGNDAAARLAGVAVARIRLAVYAIAAFCAGIGAVMLTGRLTSSQPVSGALGLELSAAAAVLLGGASFTGGTGSIAGTAIGVLFLGVLANGITLAGVPSYWHGIATGAVLVLAVALDRFRSR